MANGLIVCSRKGPKYRPKVVAPTPAEERAKLYPKGSAGVAAIEAVGKRAAKVPLDKRGVPAPPRAPTPRAIESLERLGRALEDF